MLVSDLTLYLVRMLDSRQTLLCYVLYEVCLSEWKKVTWKKLGQGVLRKETHSDFMILKECIVWSETTLRHPSCLFIVLSVNINERCYKLYLFCRAQSDHRWT